MTGFGKHLGYTPDEMHDICRFKFLRNAIQIEGERLPLLKTTTKLTTAEMADYQDMIERWAAGLGFIFDERWIMSKITASAIGESCTEYDEKWRYINGFIGILEESIGPMLYEQ